MPKLFRMPLVCLGTHQAPQMEVRVTPQRARHWIDSFRQIRDEKNKVPIPWGHQLKAVPYGDAEARKYAMARWNAGNLVGLEYNPATNWIDAVGTVPPGYDVETDDAGRPTGRLVNPTDHTTVSEMSAGIGNWRDGKGKVWKDVIVHAALCTLPVVAGSPGVTAALATDGAAREPAALYAATLEADGVEYLYTLGTATMADDKKPKGDAEADVDVGLADDLPPVPDVPAAVPTPLPATTPEAQTVADILSYCGAVNLPVPADTTAANLLERLKTCLATVAALGFKFQAPTAAAPQAQAQIDTSTAGAQPEQAGPGTAYMSTEPGQTVTLSADAGEVVEAYAQERREMYAGEWDKLGLAPDTLKREKTFLATAKPAVDPVTKRVTIPDARDRLALARDARQNRAGVTAELTRAAAPAATLATEAVPEANPARPAPAGPDREYLKFLAGAAGLELKST